MSYPISATFIDEISYDVPSSNWTNEEWAKDLDNMKEVGIDTLVFIRGWFYGRCIYPSKVLPTMKKDDEDFLGFILEEAEKRQMKVFVGLYISTVTWNDGNYQTEIEKNKLFIREVLERYGKSKAFVGWYIPHETGGNSYNIKYVMDGLCELCKQYSPEKKIFVSPFFRARGTSAVVYSPERTFEEWNNIFADCGKYIDYCAVQDGSAKPDELGGYLKEMKKEEYI